MHAADDWQHLLASEELPDDLLGAAPDGMRATAPAGTLTRAPDDERTPDIQDPRQAMCWEKLSDGSNRVVVSSPSSPLSPMFSPPPPLALEVPSEADGTVGMPGALPCHTSEPGGASVMSCAVLHAPNAVGSPDSVLAASWPASPLNSPCTSPRTSCHHCRLSVKDLSPAAVAAGAGASPPPPLHPAGTTATPALDLPPYSTPAADWATGAAFPPPPALPTDPVRQRAPMGPPAPRPPVLTSPPTGPVPPTEVIQAMAYLLTGPCHEGVSSGSSALRSGDAMEAEEGVGVDAVGEVCEAVEWPSPARAREWVVRQHRAVAMRRAPAPPVPCLTTDDFAAAREHMCVRG
eukprot:TRINITY_DN1095_c2_g1_i3.p1 TRINITY_DN1095_c2_g1~~TRINITY_DN1095_c2_g1_i3.p1  ORF type:complete len:392 (-),score=-3.82 TRINITY_DN1095_c2_g1_i3:85-1128(-)